MYCREASGLLTAEFYVDEIGKLTSPLLSTKKEQTQDPQISFEQMLEEYKQYKRLQECIVAAR